MVKATKAKKLRAIKWYVDRGYSANQIQNKLKSRGLGIRRKTLLTEIRNIKKREILPEKRKKYIPKKYRKKFGGVQPVKKPIMPIYRMSLIIPSLPVHSRPFKRNYLGFRLNAFSFNKELLNQNREKLRLILIRKTGAYIGSIYYAQEQLVRVESPTALNMINPHYLNGKWFFAVEQEGREREGDNGYI